MTDLRVCQQCRGVIIGRNANARFCCRKCQKQSVYASDPSRQRARCKAFREKDPESHRARCKLWRAKNPTLVKSNWAAWYSEHQENRKCISRLTHRTRAAAQHMQDTIAAIPAIMALIAKLENANDQ